MAIAANEISAVSVGELLRENLRIPHYQRPYSWRPDTALQLLEDIRDASSTDPSSLYVLGSVILHAEDDHRDVVDGQQRLITLRMILGLLAQTLPPMGNPQTPIARARHALARAIDVMDDEARSILTNYVTYRCQLVRIVTDDVDEAFRVFDSQNYRGRPLDPHDLLKAYHLRQMDGESEALKAAVVDSWERAGAKELDQLFSTYLYRIVKWSRGERAPGFTAHSIDMFKGISKHAALSPRARYHLAAQSVMPILEAWQPTGGSGETVSQHSRFQIDAPVLAGRQFFEMTEFMLAELRRLKQRPFPTGASSRGESATFETWLGRSRYRKSVELYLASMLYYVNNFGDHHLEAAEDALFEWSFQLRVRLQRVQQASVDLLARGSIEQPSAFVLMRNADDGRVVQRLEPDLGSSRRSHETKLRNYLQDKVMLS